MSGILFIAPLFFWKISFALSLLVMANSSIVKGGLCLLVFSSLLGTLGKRSTVKPTASEMSSVKQTWYLFTTQEEKDSLAITIMMQLFAAYPMYKKKFPSLESLPYTQLARHPDVAKHGKGMIDKLELYMDAMYTYRTEDAVVEELILLGQKHIEKKVGPQAFQDATNIILETIEIVLSRGMNHDGSTAWKKFMDYLASIMQQGLKYRSSGSSPLAVPQHKHDSREDASPMKDRRWHRPSESEIQL